MSHPILLIRHAETSWNASGRWQGQADPPLSPRGREQARRLAVELADEPFDLVITSDLLRASETAQWVARSRGLAATPDPRFRELDVGTWSGCTRAEIANDDAARLEQFEAGDPEVRPGGGETRGEIRLRVRSAAAALLDRYAGQRVALVTHLGVIRALWPGTELANAEFRWWNPEREGALANREHGVL